MSEDDKLSRRDLLKLGAGVTALAAVGWTIDTMRDDQSVPPHERNKDDFDIPTATGTFDQFQKARTSDDLSQPSVEPAIALTNEGWYEWREGASEWTPLPSWWVRRFGSPNRHVPEGYIRRFNDTLYLPPGTDLAAAVDRMDGGRIVLERGRYPIGSRVRIPGNVVVEGQGIESVIQPETDTDMFLIGGDVPSKRGNATALRNLAIDTTSVRDYTSTVVTFTDDETYHGGIEYLQDVVFHMLNSGKRGTGIRLVDESGTGIAAVTFGNVRMMFPSIAIHVEVNGGGFVNGNASRNVWVREPRVGIREVVNGGVIRSNDWNFRVNGNSAVERVLENRGDENRYRLFVEDLMKIDGPALVVEGDRNVLHNQGGSPYLWRWVADTGVGNEYEDRSRKEWFLPQGNLPYWFDTTGRGRLVDKGNAVRLVGGRGRGDEFALASPKGLFDASQYPWIRASFKLGDSASNGLTRLGFAGAYIVVDPEDTLETGTTDEFLTQLGDGSDASVKPTGIPLDTETHSVAIRVIQSDSWRKYDLLWVLDGTGLRFERGIGNRDFRPWFGVRNTGGGRPSVELSELVELRYSGPR